VSSLSGAQNIDVVIAHAASRFPHSAANKEPGAAARVVEVSKFRDHVSTFSKVASLCRLLWKHMDLKG
jgi:hypothetical protein